MKRILAAAGIAVMAVLGLSGCHRWECPGTVASCQVGR